MPKKLEDVLDRLAAAIEIQGNVLNKLAEKVGAFKQVASSVDSMSSAFKEAQSNATELRLKHERMSRNIEKQLKSKERM